LTNCRNIEIYIPYKGNDFDKETQQEILDEVYELFKQAEILKKKRESLINQANSVVVNTLKIPLPDEKNRCFLCQLPPEPTERLDALFNNPFRENLIKNLKQYPYRELEKLIKPQYRESIRPTDFYKLVELEHIDAETGRIIASREVSELGSKKFLITANSILVAKLQPEKGKIVIVPREYDGNVGSSELVPILLESSDISLEYLWAVLRSNYVLRQWALELTGSSRMRIGSTELKQTIIPIPDKKIQEEIVEEIKSLIEESDRLLQKSLELFEKAKHTFVNAVIN